MEKQHHRGIKVIKIFIHNTFNGYINRGTFLHTYSTRAKNLLPRNQLICHRLASRGWKSGGRSTATTKCSSTKSREAKNNPKEAKEKESSSSTKACVGCCATSKEYNDDKDKDDNGEEGSGGGRTSKEKAVCHVWAECRHKGKRQQENL